MLEIDRKTVRKVLNGIDLKGYVEHKKRSSSITHYKEYVYIQANKGLTAIRIYQDLKTEFDYKAIYDSVRRYLKNFRSAKSPYMFLSSLPGEDAQG